MGFLSGVNSVFPVPSFLSLRAAGIDISDERIRVCSLRAGKEGYVIDTFGEYPVTRGAIERGIMKRPEEVRTVLKQIQKIHNIHLAHISLPEERVYLVTLDVLPGTREEVRDSILLQLPEQVPVSPDQAIFDYSIIGPSQKEGMVQVAVCVLLEEDVLPYVSVFEGTNILPVTFEMEAHAIARAMVPQGGDLSYLIVDVGKYRTGVSFVHAGVVRFASTIDIGSEMVTDALEKQLKLERSVADITKCTRALSRADDDRDFVRVATPVLDPLRNELSRLLSYFESRALPSGDHIDGVLLCGGGSHMKGFPEYLEVLMSTKVKRGNPWLHINSFDRYIPDRPFSLALGDAAVLGLALKGIEPPRV